MSQNNTQTNEEVDPVAYPSPNRREEVVDVVEKVEPNNKLRLHYIDGAGTSSLQPEHDDVIPIGQGRFRLTTILGDPIIFTYDELVEKILESGDIREMEVVFAEDGPCPDCGRGVHKDGSHALSCSQR